MLNWYADVAKEKLPVSILTNSQEGKPILQLPEKSVELVTVEFSPDEREVRAPPLYCVHPNSNWCL